MTYNELRKDYLLDRWVVIATARSRRPTDFAKKDKPEPPKPTSNCPMEPGNEHMTPPATLIYLKTKNGIKKTKDKDNERIKNWIIRVIPNLYPAFTPPQTEITAPTKTFDYAPAIGHHEVLVESQHHNEHPAETSLGQLTHVINAYNDRLRELARKPYVKYVSIFRNHGLQAGASLSHAHSQIIATPFTPTIVKQEIMASKKHKQQHGTCVFCDIIKKERKSPRHIYENSDFTVFAPYASINPSEFWIFPKKHQTTPLQMTPTQVDNFALTLKTSLAALKHLLNDPPYNYGIHLTTNKNESHYHWHLEVYPCLAIWAGFEKSTGMYINAVTPETAAESLGNTIRA
jgi:UDPglucose--hexose-1-phosphate uridylyltransferase